MGKRLLQLMRFCTVGIACLALGVAILAGLHDLAGVNYLVAYVSAFILCNIAGYVLNARFTFFARSVNHGGAMRYLLINAALLCVNTVAMRLLVYDFRVWYLAAAVLLGAVNTPISFIAQRLITYREQVVRREARV